MNLMDRRPLGIYVHIPFCIKKCAYCDFLSAPAKEDTKKQYVEVLLEEIQSFQSDARKYIVQTVFFGGGTPSVLDANDIVKILEKCKEVFLIEKQAEITIEINPGTLCNENGENKLFLYHQAGINRISMGLQSVHKEELKLLGRVHTFEEFLMNYKKAREIGFQNINIDLMSALPGQTLEAWKKSLKKVIELKPEHISAYSLIIEEGTSFDKIYGEGGKGQDELPDEETDRKMYQATNEMLQAAGYHRYEISNYALEGYESKHNSSYWIGTEYVGFGLGASSYLKEGNHYIRFKKEEKLSDYQMSASQNQETGENQQLRKEIEILTRNQQMEEFMFLGLRRMEGISEFTFQKRFGVEIEVIYGKKLKKLLQQNLLIKRKDKILLTEQGIDLSNYVFAEFLLDTSY